MIFQQRDQLEKKYSAVTDRFFPREALFWLWELPSEMLYLGHVSHPLKRFSGKKRRWQALIHPQDRKDFMARFNDMVLSAKNGDHYDFFHRLEMDSDAPRWVLSKFRALDRDENGLATRVIASSFDLETLNRKKEMYDSATRLHHVLEAAEAGLFDWDAETNEVYYSPRYAAMMGYDPGLFPDGLNEWVSRVHRDDIEATMNLQYGYINSPELGDVFESVYRFRAADGTYDWITSRGKIVRRDKNGRAVRIIGLHTIINELQETQEALINIANTDQLTRLSSRLAFDTGLASLTEADYPVSLIYIDLDGLKLINDNLGHEAGDHLLMAAADIVRQSFRARDTIARVGGDEFVALLPRCPVSVALRLMRHIRAAGRKYNAAHPDNPPVFMSIGMASTEQDIDLFRLQAMADSDMIRRKRKNAGRHYRILSQWIDDHADRRIQDTNIH